MSHLKFSKPDFPFRIPGINVKSSILISHGTKSYTPIEWLFTQNFRDIQIKSNQILFIYAETLNKINNYYKG